MTIDGPGVAEPEPTSQDAETALGAARTMLTTFVAAAVIVSLGGLAGLALGRNAHHMSTAADAKMQGLMLETVSAQIASHYRFAAANAKAYAEVPCFCGCVASLSHRFLLDCFVRPESGWEPHASGCYVCIQESQIVRRLLGQGESPGAARDAVVARFDFNP